MSALTGRRVGYGISMAALLAAGLTTGTKVYYLMLQMEKHMKAELKLKVVFQQLLKMILSLKVTKLEKINHSILYMRRTQINVLFMLEKIQNMI